MRLRLLIITALCVLVGGCVAQPAQVNVRFTSTALSRTSTHGEADRASHRHVKATDPVRIASVSKLVTALGVMRMVETGHLRLDDDVQRRLGWPLRNPAYPNTAITLRMLLSHTSSLNDGVDYVVPLGRRLQDVLADPRAWDATHVPGHYFKYANINFPVIASVMEATSGERFDSLMERLVFKPLALDACFNWTTCSDQTVAKAVVLYDQNGTVRKDDLHGRRPGCPVATLDNCDLSRWHAGENGALFSPQGGLRISMLGLAQIGQLLLGEDGSFLTRESYQLLKQPVWTFDGKNGDSEDGFYCAYGLAVQQLSSPFVMCHDNPLGDGARRFGHAGEAYGLRSGLWLDTATHTGVAFFVSAVPDEAPKGRHSSFTAAEERMIGY